MQATMQVEPMFLEEIQHETGGLWHPLVRALRLLWPGGWIFWMLERWSKFANKAQEYSQHLTAMSQVQITSRWSAHPDHHRSPDPWPYRTNPYVWREWSRGWMCWQEIFIGFFYASGSFQLLTAGSYNRYGHPTQARCAGSPDIGEGPFNDECVRNVGPIWCSGSGYPLVI